MPKLADVLKDEIRRLARKEIKALTTQTSKTTARYRKDIAELKRQNAVLTRRVAALESGKERQPADAGERPVRFSARSVKAQRKRLGLSASSYGRLIGVTGMTIYNWEQGKSRPKDRQLAALVDMRSIGKREAQTRLDQLDAPASGPASDSTRKTTTKR